MPTIIPTVGRKVYFYNDEKQAEPHDATIIKVWASPDQAQPQSAVNLRVTHPLTGESYLVTSSVAYDTPQPWPHYRWMPYQVGQAAQHPAVAAMTPITSDDVAMTKLNASDN